MIFRQSTLSFAVVTLVALSLTASAPAKVRAQAADAAAFVAGPLGIRIDSTVRAAEQRGFSGVALVAKDFTAVAILQLMEQGKLSLSDSLPKFFRNVRLEKRPITVQQLLNHRAGFPQHIGGDFGAITPLSVESSTETQLVIVARAGGDELTLTYEVEAAAPHRLISLKIETR